MSAKEGEEGATAAMAEEKEGEDEEGVMVEQEAMAELPDSVLLRILELLPLRERLRAARVCRRWRRLVMDRSVWRHVDLSSDRVTLRTLWHLVRRHLGASLRTLRLQGTLLTGGKRHLLSPALLLALGKRCPQLQRLSLAEMNLRPVPYESFPPSLTTLELRHCEIPAAWFCGALPHLQHLIVRDVPAFSDHHLLSVSSQSRLKTLTLFGTYRITDLGVQRAAPHLEHLEHLVLRRCGVGDSAVEFLGRHGKCLRFLEISKTPSLTDAGLAALAALQHLETLHFALCNEISPDTVNALCRALPRLRNLKFGGGYLENEAVDKIRAGLPYCGSAPAP